MFGVANHPDPAHGKPFPLSRLVELRARFDVWELQRAGGLSPGAETVISANGVRVATLHALSDQISAVTDEGETEISLVEDQPMSGVPRLWFECPACQKRCRHLYLPELRCRLCLALEHSSRHVWPSNAGRIARLKRLSGNPQRRRGRYWRLSARIARGVAKLAVSLRRFNAAVEEVRDGQQR